MTKHKADEAKQPVILTLIQFAIKSLGTISPTTGGKVVYNLWFKPIRFKTPKREISIIKEAKIANYESPYGIIRIWSWGQGPTVLFIHGWSGRGTQVSEFVHPLIAAGFRVVSFDGPAHGQSTGTSTDIIKYADITNNIIAQYGPLHGVITHSFGAMVFGLTYQQDMPLNKAVFISPPATLQTPVNEFQRMLTIPQPALDYFTKKLKENYGQDLYEKVSVVENLKKITAPILVIHDEGDNVVPVIDGERISKTSSNAQLIKTSGLGHNRILSDEKVSRVVTNFMLMSD